MARGAFRRRPRGCFTPIVALACALLLVGLLSRGPQAGPRGHSSGTAGEVSLVGGLPVAVERTVFPSGLAAGTCIRYPSTQGGRQATVIIDAGHGGPDPGASGTTSAGTAVAEKSLTLAVARVLVPLLRSAGFSVVLTRVVDTAVAHLGPDDLIVGGGLSAVGEQHDIEARNVCANAANAQALVAIHFDAYSDASVGGAETIYDSARPFARDNMRLATLVQQGTVRALRTTGWSLKDRGIVDDSRSGSPALTAEGARYGHLLELGPAARGLLAHPSTMPGVLCEPLFLTNPGEADLAASDAGQQAIAQGILTALDAYFPQVTHG